MAENINVVVISHTYTISANRGKWDDLSKNYPVNLNLIVPDHWDTYLKSYQADPGSRNLKVIVLQTIFNGNVSRFFYKNILKTVVSLKPDIIHVEQEYSSLSLLQSVIIKKVFLRNAKIVAFTWENIFQKIPWYYRIVEKINLKNISACIAGSTQAAEILRQKGFNGKVIVLPQLGVNPPLLKKQSMVETSLHGIKKPIIGYVGRLVEEKGVDKLFQSFISLEIPASLLLIGKGSLKEGILARVSLLKMKDRVYILDTIPHDLVPAYMKNMDVLVLPSQPTQTWVEQFGHVLIEAMGLGIPVIGSDSGAIPEVVGSAGIIFKHSSVSDLTKSIERVLRDSKLRKELSELGRKRVVDNYTDSSIATSMFNLYEELFY